MRFSRKCKRAAGKPRFKDHPQLPFLLKHDEHDRPLQSDEQKRSASILEILSGSLYFSIFPRQYASRLQDTGPKTEAMEAHMRPQPSSFCVLSSFCDVTFLRHHQKERSGERSSSLCCQFLKNLIWQQVDSLPDCLCKAKFPQPGIHGFLRTGYP